MTRFVIILPRYARIRIQGKATMLKRFENSPLIAKDDKYRSMVFVSHGERKGQRECFGYWSKKNMTRIRQKTS